MRVAARAGRGVSEVTSTFFLSLKNRAYRSRVKVVLGQFEHAGFIFDVHLLRFGRVSGVERAQRCRRGRRVLCPVYVPR